MIAAKLGIAMLALQASVCLADSAPCAYRESPITESGMAVESGASRVTTVELLSMTPGEQGRVERGTVLEVDVEFHIVDFKPGQFFLDVDFPTAYGTKSAGGRESKPSLRSASGRAHLCVPLAEIFDDANVRWPLTALVNVHQDESDHSHRPIAGTKLTTFSEFSVPADQETKRASVPPEEYVRALIQAFSFFEFPSAFNELCIQRFPATQPAFARAYPAWRERNATTIDYVNRLQLEQFRMNGEYPDEVARQIFDGVRKSMRTEIGKFTDYQLNEACRSTLRQIEDLNYDTNAAIGNELRIVRQWQQGHPGPGAQ